MMRAVRRFGGRAAALLLALLLLGLVARAVVVVSGPGLAPWHLVVPEEPPREAVARMSWDDWAAAEVAMLGALRRRLAAELRPEDRVAASRYTPGGPLDVGWAEEGWNRSRRILPAGAPRGAVVLLHGLTDSPYSLRHLAGLYAAEGWAVLAPRLPGHGTVPAGLTEAVAADWRAVSAMALREAARLAGGAPVHLVGYSNGGALAAHAALDALDDPSLPRLARLVLVSPMVGVTGFARFAGLAGLPAFLPRFAAAAWLGIQPEYNPYKYNSFPVNAARQSHLLSSGLRARLAARPLDGFPPVLAFQSVVDATVSAAAVVDGLFMRLPANGSELVLFDINRAAALGPLVAPGAEARIERLLPPAPRPWALTLVTNAAPGERAAVARRWEAGRETPTETPLGLSWPDGMFSLSHLALALPVTDGLYGLAPDPADRPELPRLGAISARGERGVLAVALEDLLRATSNPFFPLVRARVADGLGAR